MAESGSDDDPVETTDGGTSTEESEWQFGLDDVGPDGAVAAEPEPLEPGDPSLENVVFVLLGVVGTLLLLSTVI
jgi:hypothetical protein